MEILAVDPGTEKSAFVYCGISDGKVDYIIDIGIVSNKELLQTIKEEDYDGLVVEMIQSFGMPAGSSLFETCVWIGRFTQVAVDKSKYNFVDYIYRSDEKMTLCGTMKSNDSAIRKALIDIYAKDVPNGGKGTKAERGFFYGFHDDIWQAFAVAHTFAKRLDKKNER